MNHIRRSTFFLGFLIASLVALIVWYYQKSTSAEDGALDVLNRYASSQARIRDLEEQLVASTQFNSQEQARETRSVSLPDSYQPDDLQQIKGIGPAFAQSLSEAGVTTFAQLSQLTVGELREIVGSRADVDRWIKEAATLAGNFK